LGALWSASVEYAAWNCGVIEEFRANGGEVGVEFEGRPLLILGLSANRADADLGRETSRPGDQRAQWNRTSRGMSWA
jgi:hypothetical protein